MDPTRAFELEVAVKAARGVERSSWVSLAESLAAFHEEEAWEALGYEKFTDWLGVPEVGLSRRTAYRLLQAWRWASDHGVSTEQLLSVDLTKLAVVMGAVEEGRATAWEALSDCEVLSRSDLTEKYLRGAERAPRAATETCPDCGCERKVPA